MNHLQPGEILASLTEIGVNKAKSPASKLVLLGIMAGALHCFCRRGFDDGRIQSAGCA